MEYLSNSLLKPAEEESDEVESAVVQKRARRAVPLQNQFGHTQCAPTESNRAIRESPLLHFPMRQAVDQFLVGFFVAGEVDEERAGEHGRDAGDSLQPKHDGRPPFDDKDRAEDYQRRTDRTHQKFFHLRISGLFPDACLFRRDRR